MIYNLIGRAVVKLGWMYLRRRVDVRTVVLVGAGTATVVSVATVAGYLVTRDVPEA